MDAFEQAVVRLTRQAPRRVRAVKVTGAEHDRLWQRWLEAEPYLDGFVSGRTTETPVILLEPLGDAAGEPPERPAPE